MSDGRAVQHVLQLNAALSAVLDLHQSVTMFTCPEYPDRSFASREEAAECMDCDPDALVRQRMCRHCMSVEDGPDGYGPSEVGYARSDWPCATVRAVAAALDTPVIIDATIAGLLDVYRVRVTRLEERAHYLANVIDSLQIELADERKARHAATEVSDA